ncbi:MAG: GNAT family N-acetyltransferase [bacterium]
MNKNSVKKYTLKDGSVISIRAMTKNDVNALHEFFTRIPEEDRLFLKHNVADKKVIETWAKELDYNSVLPLLAFDKDNKIIGDATLHMKDYGWSRHIGEIRIVVSRAYRNKGVGLALSREIFLAALERKLSKIVAQMAADQKGAIKVFEKLGFTKEAELKNHIMDLKGQTHNLVIMSNDVKEAVKAMEAYEAEQLNLNPAEG